MNKKANIIYDNIKLFYGTHQKSKNDMSNKLREDIIINIINGTISNEWFSDPQWNTLRMGVFKFLHSITDYHSVVAIKKAGRGHHSDFSINFNINQSEIKTKNIEWKYGAKKVEDCPQWVSPMKPSQYLDQSFEEYFYNYHLDKIVKGNDKPPVEVYLKEIHSDKPKCMEEYQMAYYKGARGSSKYTGEKSDIDYYKMCKDVSNNAIKKFIEISNVNIPKLNEYLYNTQMDKIYMCCKDGEITMDVPNKEDYTIDESSIKKTKNQYVGKTVSGRTIKILLRWKNGNGIAFPAFQIK